MQRFHALKYTFLLPLLIVLGAMTASAQSPCSRLIDFQVRVEEESNKASEVKRINVEIQRDVAPGAEKGFTVAKLGLKKLLNTSVPSFSLLDKEGRQIPYCIPSYVKGPLLAKIMVVTKPGPDREKFDMFQWNKDVGDNSSILNEVCDPYFHWIQLQIEASIGTRPIKPDVTVRTLLKDGSSGQSLVRAQEFSDGSGTAALANVGIYIPRDLGGNETRVMVEGKWESSSEAEGGAGILYADHDAITEKEWTQV